MRYIWQHIQAIIESYNGNVPLTHFLKQYYKRNPKLGSRDRKILSEMAYSWYRCSKGINADIFFEDKVKQCLQLTGSNSKYIQQFLPAEQSAPFDIEQLSRAPVNLSTGITRHDWLQSILLQPDVFLRLRNKAIVIGLFSENQVPFTFINEKCISIPNSSPVDKMLPDDSYAVQDASSQETCEYFQPKDNEAWWDCCSGAGGKSLALTDSSKSVQLTVTDKRDSILSNLVKRFKQYHLNVPEHYVVDVSSQETLKKQFGDRKFDNIICDVPCTGSGTWARTPEQLYYFDPSQLQTLPALQSQIAANASEYLKSGGKLFYITCSIFQEENEDVVNVVCKKTGMELQSQQLINGIEIKADSMFVAVLTKR